MKIKNSKISLSLFTLTLLQSCNFNKDEIDKINEKEDNNDQKKGNGDHTREIAFISGLYRTISGEFYFPTNKYQADVLSEDIIWQSIKEYSLINNYNCKFYQPTIVADDIYINEEEYYFNYIFDTVINNDPDVVFLSNFSVSSNFYDLIKTKIKNNSEIRFIICDQSCDHYPWLNSTYSELDNCNVLSFKYEESGYIAGYLSIIEGFKNINLCSIELFKSFGIFSDFALGYVQGINDASKKEGIEKVRLFNTFYNFDNSLKWKVESQLKWILQQYDLDLICNLIPIEISFDVPFGDELIDILENNEINCKLILNGMEDYLDYYPQAVFSGFFDWGTPIYNTLDLICKSNESNLLKESFLKFGISDNAVGVTFKEDRFKKVKKDDVVSLVNNISSGIIDIQYSTENFNFYNLVMQNQISEYFNNIYFENYLAY